MKVAMLAPIAWRTPPHHYGPWELVSSLLTEGLVKKGVDVTLFATADSKTTAKLDAVVPKGYEEDQEIRANAKVWESLHIANCFEKARQFDIIHNQFDFLPLTYSGLVKTPVVTTIHGFSSEKIIPVYKKYNKNTFFVSISNSSRHPDLNYIQTVYHGIDMSQFDFQEHPQDYLLFFGRIHPEKGALEAIEIAKRSGKKLVIAGIIQDQNYFDSMISPHINNKEITYVGAIGGVERSNILKNAEAILHPIDVNEAFGLSVVEAMACGTPVIAFNRGSMPEVILDQKTGFLVGDVDGAVDAIKNIKLIDRLACRKWVEDNFSQEKMVEGYLEVYKKIITE